MNDKKIDKYFTDGFARAVLIEMVLKSKYKDNKKLKEGILYKASYEQVVMSAFYGDPLGYVKEDATSDAKLRQAEELSSLLLQLGPGILLMGRAEKGVKAGAVKAFGKYGAVKRGKFVPTQGAKGLAKFAGKAGKFAHGTGAFWIGMLGLQFGLTLLNKAVFALLRKIISKCRKDCKNRFKAEKDFRSLKVQICTSQCKIKDLVQTISRFRADVSKCRAAKNPESCQQSLIKHIARMNDMLVEEKERLRAYSEQLRAKMSQPK